jgi:D-inositol-3-phosphate glycosyltransferase
VQQDWEREPLARIQVEREVLVQSDALIAESKASKHHMVQDYGIVPQRIEVVPCGVDPTIFHPQDRRQARLALGLPEAVPLLLFVGRLQPLKGIDILLRSAHEVRQTYPHLQVLVVGGGVDADDDYELEERQRLQALTAHLGLAQQVHFIQAQPQEVLTQYYAAADVLVMPSHYESFGMVVLEAMACGTPVVASRVGGMASTVVHGHTGFLAPVGDVHAFARAITELLATPSSWQAMSQASQRRAERYTWPRITDRTQRLYRRLVHQHTNATGPPGTMIETSAVGRAVSHTIVPVLSEPSIS